MGKFSNAEKSVIKQVIKAGRTEEEALEKAAQVVDLSRAMIGIEGTIKDRLFPGEDRPKQPDPLGHGKRSQAARAKIRDFAAAVVMSSEEE